MPNIILNKERYKEGWKKYFQRFIFNGKFTYFFEIFNKNKQNFVHISWKFQIFSKFLEVMTMNLKSFERSNTANITFSIKFSVNFFNAKKSKTKKTRFIFLQQYTRRICRIDKVLPRLNE